MHGLTSLLTFSKVKIHWTEVSNLIDFQTSTKMHDSVSILVNLKSVNNCKLKIQLYFVEIVFAGVECPIRAITLPHHTFVIDSKTASMLSTLVSLPHLRGGTGNTRYTVTT